MRRISFLATLVALTVVGGCSDSGAPVKDEAAPVPVAQHVPSDTLSGIAVPQGSGFDFYVLALSWSPGYCAREGRGADPRQCNAARPFGFIVHGLWPQYERGAPDFCNANSPSRGEIDSVLDLTPSPGLLRHEWEKHGSCSGLSPGDYFAAMRLARRKVTIPAQFNNPRQPFRLSAQALEQAFVRANPGLTGQAISAACPQNGLAEVRICLDKALNFRACPEVDRGGCRSQSISVEPMN